MTDAVATVAAPNAIEQITKGGGFYSSLKTETRAEKMAFLRAINNSQNLKDAVKAEPGLELHIVDIVLQNVEIANESTGVVEPSVRITLVTDEGKAYHATSVGIAQSLKQAFGVLGEPGSWEEPLEVDVAEERGRNGFRYLTLKF